jgi:hypothetical protein
MSVSLFVFAVADKMTLVVDVERHMEEAQELVSVNREVVHVIYFSVNILQDMEIIIVSSSSSSNSNMNMHIHAVSLNS